MTRIAPSTIAILSAIFVLALLTPGRALAWPAGLVSVTGQPGQPHPTSTWCKLPRVQSLLIETATSDEVGAAGHFLQKNLLTFNIVDDNATTFTDPYEFQPGTYYVHVGTHDPDANRDVVPNVEFSNVLKFEVRNGPRVVGGTAPCPRLPGGGGGGGGGGGAGDKVAPGLSLTYRKVQDVDKLFVKVRSSESARIKASGSVKVGNASRVYRFKARTLTLPGNASTKARLKLAKKNLRKVKRALKRKRLRAKITVTATDAAGNRRTKKATIRLKN